MKCLYLVSALIVFLLALPTADSFAGGITLNSATPYGTAPMGNYGAVEYADPGYQDDGKPRYPIDTERHIRAAWSYIHKQHNQSRYSTDQVKLIEAKIIAAWKKLIDPAGPPSAGNEKD